MSNPHDSQPKVLGSLNTAVHRPSPVELVQRMDDGSYSTPSLDIIKRYGVLADLVEEVSTTVMFRRLKDPALSSEAAIKEACRHVERRSVHLKAHEQVWVLTTVVANIDANAS